MKNLTVEELVSFKTGAAFINYINSFAAVMADHIQKNLSSTQQLETEITWGKSIDLLNQTVPGFGHDFSTHIIFKIKDNPQGNLSFVLGFCELDNETIGLGYFQEINEEIWSHADYIETPPSEIFEESNITIISNFLKNKTLPAAHRVHGENDIPK
jgi:hypothetical protein